MSWPNTLATASRILRQLRHNPRTVMLMLLLPSILLLLIRYVFAAQPQVFDRVGLILLGILPFTTMFLVTSIAMLRERTAGTLERLLTTPLAKLDLLLGYGLAFAAAAALQSVITAVVAYALLGLDTSGSPWLAGVIAVANGVLGMALGLLVSAFASTEFQAVQFMPLVVMPQVLLCGLLAPREQMAGRLHVISDYLPMTYSVDALIQVGVRANPTERVWLDLGIVVVCALAALALGAATLQRRTD